MYQEEPFIADYTSIEEAMIPENIRRIFLFHSCESLKKAANKLSNGISEGTNPKEVWDKKAGIALT